MNTHPRLARRSRVPLIAAIVAFIMLSTTLAAFLQNRRAKAEGARQQEMTSAVTALRKAIGDYKQQHGRYPHSLGELPQVPRDPVTNSATTWQPELEESVSVDDFTAKSTKPESFVVNVRSGAKGHDAAGRAWSDY
jgi:type II secretory pathway pseudopilin PulG